jgi:hypothetical protein
MNELGLLNSYHHNHPSTPAKGRLSLTREGEGENETKMED